MSVVQSGYFAALVLGVPLGSVLGQRVGWRAGFIAFGVIAFITYVLVLLFLPEDKHHLSKTESDAAVARRFDGIRAVFETRERIAAICAAFFVSGGFAGFILYIGSWLTSLGLKTGQVGLVFIAVGAAALVGALVAGPMADRFGKRTLSIFSTLTLAVSLILIPRFELGFMLLLAFLVASLSFAFRQGPVQALATELVPRKARGALVAVRNMFSQAGIAVSSFVSGMLYDQYGYGKVGLFSAVMTGVAAICIFLMGEPQGANTTQRGDR